MPGIEETVQLEGFGESLRGRRIFVVSSSPVKTQGFLKSRLEALDAEVAYRGRKILVVQHASPPPRWALKLAWDTIIHVRDVQDLKLAVTVIQNCTKPARVVWLGSAPSPAVSAILSKVDALTWISVGETTPSDTWDAIFWSPDTAQEEVEAACALRMGPAASGKIRSVLRELRASEVGLVWSSIGETDKRGGLYWYDPAEEGSGAVTLDPAETAEMLRALADSLVKR
jgi:hypothetical protein